MGDVQVSEVCLTLSRRILDVELLMVKLYFYWIYSVRSRLSEEFCCSWNCSESVRMTFLEQGLSYQLRLMKKSTWCAQWPILRDFLKTLISNTSPFPLRRSPHLVVQNQAWKHQDNLWNLFKVDKETKVTSVASCWCLYSELWTDFIYFSGASITDFDKANADWDFLFKITHLVKVSLGYIVVLSVMWQS